VAPRLLSLALAAACALILAAPGGAVVGGSPDGNAHPYVGVVRNGVTACSGTLLSPTVLLTAAHCAFGQQSAFGANTVNGAPIVRVSFDPLLARTPPDQRVYSFGTFYSDAYDPNLSSSAHDPDNHDVAIVVFDSLGCAVCSAVPAGATLGQYASLPRVGAVDALASNTPLEIVGYGVQDLLRGGGPCGGPCKPQPDGDSAFVRISAVANLIANNSQTSGRFIQIHQNKGGVCFGDSGGPDLLPGTQHTVLAVSTNVSNDMCAGVSYSYRVDTSSALAFIQSTAAKWGASL
jgi:hypothetical protein